MNSLNTWEAKTKKVQEKPKRPFRETEKDVVNGSEAYINAGSLRFLQMWFNRM